MAQQKFNCALKSIFPLKPVKKSDIGVYIFFGKKCFGKFKKTILFWIFVWKTQSIHIQFLKLCFLFEK